MKFMYRVTVFMVLIFGITLVGATPAKVETVKDIDLERYTGTWYEIARLPNKHQKELVEVTSTLKRNRDGRYTLVNSGYKGSRGGKRTTVKGDVSIPDPKNTGDLKVKVLLFSVGYKIIDVDKTNYRYALVTSDSNKYLWIFSRSPVMEPGVFEKMVASAREKGFDVDRLEMVNQDANSAVAER